MTEHINVQLSVNGAVRELNVEPRKPSPMRYARTSALRVHTSAASTACAAHAPSC